MLGTELNAPGDVTMFSQDPVFKVMTPRFPLFQRTRYID